MHIQLLWQTTYKCRDQNRLLSQRGDLSDLKGETYMQALVWAKFDSVTCDMLSNSNKIEFS